MLRVVVSYRHTVCLIPHGQDSQLVHIYAQCGSASTVVMQTASIYGLPAKPVTARLISGHKIEILCWAPLQEGRLVHLLVVVQCHFIHLSHKHRSRGVDRYSPNQLLYTRLAGQDLIAWLQEKQTITTFPSSTAPFPAITLFNTERPWHPLHHTSRAFPFAISCNYLDIDRWITCNANTYPPCQAHHVRHPSTHLLNLNLDQQPYRLSHLHHPG